jgi:hypothetical protein
MCGLQRSSWVSPQWCLVSSVLVRRRRPSHGDGDWCSVTGCDVRSGRRGALGRDERSALADERTGCRRRGSSQTGDRFAAAPIEPVGAADPGDEPWNKSHRRSDVRRTGCGRPRSRRLAAHHGAVPGDRAAGRIRTLVIYFQPRELRPNASLLHRGERRPKQSGLGWSKSADQRPLSASHRLPSSW